MRQGDKYSDFLRRIRASDQFWEDGFAKLQFALAVRRLMQQQEPPVTAKALAMRLDVEPPTLSKQLSGTENLGIETMARIASALGAAVHIHVAKRGVPVRFVEGNLDSSASVEVQLRTYASSSLPPAERIYRVSASP